MGSNPTATAPGPGRGVAAPGSAVPLLQVLQHPAERRRDRGLFLGAQQVDELPGKKQLEIAMFQGPERYGKVLARL